jgi:ADP-sugar diphosphatase
MYTSPANLDEFISLLLWEKELDRKEIEALKGKLTGLRKLDEMITLQVCDYDILWKQGARDAKTLGAWALYEGLNRSGKLEEKLRDIRIGKLEKGRSS